MFTNILRMCFYLLVFSISMLFAQIGDVIWQEHFNDLQHWIKSTGNGTNGWGNAELQFYTKENVQISEIPDEPGNYALHISAKKQSGADIVDQWGNPLEYTSGRVTTRSTVAVHYGLVEVRMRVPNLNLGGWPAVWMQGISTLGWPKNGELDIMEMGQSKAFRDVHDDHNGGNGLNNSTVNQVVGANAIWYSKAAQNDQNPTGAAAIAWDANYCRPYYNYDNPLNDRFVIYRMYWDDAQIRFTIIDDQVEHDLYTGPFPLGDDTDAFRQPFYFIINLAIGGTFTDAYNLGNLNSGEPVSMPFPADMYVDYIKVFEWNGKGEVTFGGAEPESDSFGLYTDTTPTQSALTVGQNADVYVWENTLSGGSIAPFEGDNVLSWKTTGKGWFGAGIMSRQPLNLSEFGGGDLKFMIKIPANVSFRIGLNDTWGNDSYVDFPAHQEKYSLLRDGKWGQAVIPISEIRGTKVDMRNISYAFTILETNGAACEFALDDIYLDNGVTNVALYDTNSPDDYQLLQNYPNPFNPQTTITFQLAAAQFVNVSIYDINGKWVDTLINESKSAGVHTVSWNAGNHPSGVYVYKITAGDFVDIRKMVVVR